MSPRRTVAEARLTRAGIVRHGVAVASVDGLEGLTIGRLAADLGMSKSGVLDTYPSVAGVEAAFAAAGFRTVALERVAQSTAGWRGS